MRKRIFRLIGGPTDSDLALVVTSNRPLGGTLRLDPTRPIVGNPAAGSVVSRYHRSPYPDLLPAADDAPGDRRVVMLPSAIGSNEA